MATRTSAPRTEAADEASPAPCGRDLTTVEHLGARRPLLAQSRFCRHLAARPWPQPLV